MGIKRQNDIISVQAFEESAGNTGPHHLRLSTVPIKIKGSFTDLLFSAASLDFPHPVCFINIYKPIDTTIAGSTWLCLDPQAHTGVRAPLCTENTHTPMY